MEPPKRLHVTWVPPKLREETSGDYIARLGLWQEERRARLDGGSRSLPPLAGLSALARRLVDALAWSCYARGALYHPVGLGQRAVAGLLGLHGRGAHGWAQEVLDELEAAGALVQLQVGAGNLPAVYVLVATPGTEAARAWVVALKNLCPIRIRTGHKPEGRSFVPNTYSNRAHLCPDKARERSKARGAAPAGANPAGRPGAPPGAEATEAVPLRESLKAYLEQASPEEQERARAVTGLLLGLESEPSDRRLPDRPLAFRPRPRLQVVRTQAEHEARVRAQAAAVREGRDPGRV